MFIPRLPKRPKEVVELLSATGSEGWREEELATSSLPPSNPTIRLRHQQPLLHIPGAGWVCKRSESKVWGEAAVRYP